MTDPRAALAEALTAEWSPNAPFTENEVAGPIARLAERGVLLVTEDALADAIWRAIYDLQSRDDKQSREDAAAIFAALSGEVTE
jgi:hypothetical protein